MAQDALDRCGECNSQDARSRRRSEWRRVDKRGSGPIPVRPGRRAGFLLLQVSPVLRVAHLLREDLMIRPPGTMFGRTLLSRVSWTVIDQGAVSLGTFS